MLDDAAQRQRAAGPADDVGMAGEGDIARLLLGLGIELVEIGLPGLEPVIGIAIFAVTVAEQRAVAEGLARQLDQHLAIVLVEERPLLVEAVAVPHEAVLDQELDGVGALGAGAPAIRTPSGAGLDGADGVAHDLDFFVAGEIARDLVMVAMAFDLV